MNLDLFDLSAKITLDSSGYERGLKDAESKTSSFGSKIGGALKTLGKVTLAGLGAAAAGVAALTKSAVNAYAEYEQLAGGVEKIFDQANISQIMEDANAAYKDINMSVNEYLAAINQTGAAFAQTMGDQKGYDVARTGMKAIADFASGTGRSIEELNEKFSLITRSTASYQTIADQFSGILPATSKDFLEQAQAAGYLEESYTSLTEVPIAEYQEAVSKMLEKGVKDASLLGNTFEESTKTISGSLAMTRSAWSNLMTGLADDSADFDTLINNFVESVGALSDNLMPRITTAISGIGQLIATLAPQLAVALPDMLTTAVPALLTAASSMIQGFVGAITTSLPVIVEQGVPILMSLVEGILQNLPMLVEAALQIVMQLANGIGQSLPTLIPAIVSVVMEIVDTLLQNIPMLLEAGIQIILGLVQGLTTAIPMLIGYVPQIIETIVTTLIESLPILIEAAIEIIVALIDGLTESLPLLVAMTPQIVISIVHALLENLPMLVDAAIQIIIALAEGLIEALPQLIAVAPEIIMELLSALFGAIPMLLQAALQAVITIANGIGANAGQIIPKGRELITKLISGIAGAAGQLVSKGRELVNKVGSGIKGAISSAVNWGRDLVQNFVNGITSRLSSLASTVSNMASTIRSHLHFSEPDVGPLSDFHTYAPDMMELFAKGIRDNKKMLMDTVDDAFNFQDMIVSPTFGVNANGALPTDAYGQSGVAIYGDVNITVDGTGKNAEEIGRDLYKILSRQGVTAYAV